MRILITAGPTHEPIDPVRFIGNRSSGRMGMALAEAALGAGHGVTLVVGPVEVDSPPGVRRVDILTSAELETAVAREFPRHDLLIMAAAVADFRAVRVAGHKLPRTARLVIELEATADIVAAAARSRRADQRVVGFSLEAAGDIERARAKMQAKRLDLMVYNPPQTIGSDSIAATLLYPGRPSESPGMMDKRTFAALLLERCAELFLPGAG